MADRVKLVNAGVPTGSRRQSWDAAGDSLVNGDIIRVNQSLGYDAHKATVITSGSGDVMLRLNPVVTVFDHHDPNLFGGLGDIYDIVQSGKEFVDESQEPVIIPAGETREFSGDIKTVQIVATNDAFRLEVE